MAKSGGLTSRDVIVNVCPAATSTAAPERFWSIVTSPETFGEWVDGRVVSIDPPAEMRPGQVIRMVSPAFGREWPLRIEVGEMDPERRWIDLVAFLPFGVANHEHLTLTPTNEGGTLIRFN